jgi:predicted NBD/HSP70 family sugar kinase
MYVLFDIGGTNTRIGVSHDGLTIASHEKIPTPQEFDSLLATVRDTAQKLGDGVQISAAAGGIACPLRKDRATLLWAPNLPNAWVGKHLPHALSAALGGAPVYLENDVGVGGLGELHHGAGKGSDIMVYATVSTGVNSARFVHGVLADPGVYGYETGHQYIDIDVTLCKGCHRGTAIEYCSGADMEKQYGKKPYEVYDEKVWEEKARIVAYMLHNTILHWSPDTIVLGGSMITGSPGIALARVEHHLREIMYMFPEIPVLKQATLESVGGLYGALAVLQQKSSV